MFGKPFFVLRIADFDYSISVPDSRLIQKRISDIMILSNSPYGRKRGKDEIAVTYDNGQIFQHFGHTEMFKVYEVEDNSIKNESIIPTLGSGHGALAGFLKLNNVDTLICGGIGEGAKNALADAGIKLYGGVTGDADSAVKALLSGTLEFNPAVHCSHHDGGHNHGEGHTCGEHGCKH
jgi:predicted Fe-Mo cluster-binding NifX family protein